jgi:hypothetical protein
MHGLDEIRAKYKRFPKQLGAAMRETLIASLYELQGSVPPYPAQHEDSTYRRTGILGKSLGVNMQGKKEGTPDIFEVRNRQNRWTGHFGSRVEYAPPVIGEKQAPVHEGRWWTISTIAKRARQKIEKRFNQMAERLAHWLNSNK